MASRRERLAKRRKALGYSQEKFADQLGVATSTVVRWESGETEPQPHLRRRLARLLKATASDLEALLTPAPLACLVVPENPLDAGDADDMNRRDFLSLLTTTGAFIAIPQLDLHQDLTGRTAVTADTAGALNSHMWQVFSLSESKQAVYPLVQHQLGFLAKGMEGVRTEAAHKQLCTLAGDLYQLAGEIFFDTNRYTDAAQCYTLAAGAAKAAGAYDLWACALTRHAFIGVYERRFTVAAPMLAAASLVAQRGDGQLSTRYWVAAVQAEVCAGLGDLDGCQRALDLAEEVHALDGQIHNGGGCGSTGPGCPRNAEPATWNSASPTSPRRPWRPHWRRTSPFAAVGLYLPNSRRSALSAVTSTRRCTTARRPSSWPSRPGSGYIGKKLEGLRSRLAPLMADGRVSDLHHQISALPRAT